MSNRKRICFLFFMAIIFVSCNESFFPEGLYHYQVDKLLTNDSSKLWTLQQNEQLICTDSIFLLIEQSDDSLNLFSLTKNIDCSGFDSTFLGRAKTTSRLDNPLFTDSIVFASGNFWTVSTVTSKKLTFSNLEDSESYIYKP